MNRLDELVKAADDRGPVAQRYVYFFSFSFYMRTKKLDDTRVGPTPEQVIRGVSCREKEKENKRLLAEFIRVKLMNE